jgi:hypothetical protein
VQAKTKVERTATIKLSKFFIEIIIPNFAAIILAIVLGWWIGIPGLVFGLWLGIGLDGLREKKTGYVIQRLSQGGQPDLCAKIAKLWGTFVENEPMGIPFWRPIDGRYRVFYWLGFALFALYPFMVTLAVRYQVSYILIHTDRRLVCLSAQFFSSLMPLFSFLLSDNHSCMFRHIYNRNGEDMSSLLVPVMVYMTFAQFTLIGITWAELLLRPGLYYRRFALYFRCFKKHGWYYYYKIPGAFIAACIAMVFSLPFQFIFRVEPIRNKFDLISTSAPWILNAWATVILSVAVLTIIYPRSRTASKSHVE